MALLITEPAEADLDAIADFIARDSPRTAGKIFAAIVSTARKLQEYPLLGRAGRVAGTRELRVKGLPFLIVYEVSLDDVTIIAILHTAQDVGRHSEARTTTRTHVPGRKRRL